jgi:hypothetical protein
MRAWFASMVCSIVLLHANAAQAETFAERLGWPKGSRVLIINSDDVGMSLAASQGSVEGLEAGIVSSVTMMMPTPWVVWFNNLYLKKNPETCVGLHLQLCNEWDQYGISPVAGKLAVPGLVDPDGCFWDNNELLLANATADEVETEIRAQLDRAVTMGIRVSHLDSHMGSLFAREDYMERYVKLGIEKNLPIRIVHGVPGGFADIKGQRVQMSRKFTQKVWDAGLPVLDDQHGQSYSWETTDKTQYFIRDIRNLKPGVTEMIVHLTKPDDVIGVITDNRTKLYGDYFALTDPKILRAIEEEGVHLVSWTELKRRRDAVGNGAP